MCGCHNLMLWVFGVPVVAFCALGIVAAVAAEYRMWGQPDHF